MSKYQIEKNIPLLGRNRTTGRNAKYPFRAMKKHDSFAFDKTDLVRITSAASYFGKRNSRKFSIRKVGLTTYRIWRVK